MKRSRIRSHEMPRPPGTAIPAANAGQLGVDGNISSDPPLCDPANGQFALASNSPCAAPNNPGCGQIGAWGVGCEETPVVRVSWGEVRALFR